jgi:hypothetical protein
MQLVIKMSSMWANRTVSSDHITRWSPSGHVRNYSSCSSPTFRCKVKHECDKVLTVKNDGKIYSTKYTKS